jgi:cell division protein FtsI/penicillin-binding protein 2
VVLVEHGGHGGEAAAPMAKKVIEKYIQLQAQPVEQRQARIQGDVRAD